MVKMVDCDGLILIGCSIVPGMVDDFVQVCAQNGLPIVEIGAKRQIQSSVFLQEKGLDRQIQQLIQRQTTCLPCALQGLRDRGEKTGHYAWWLWPTEKEGFAEPSPQTKVTIETAPDFIQIAPPIWRECLEYSTELIKKNGKKVIPYIDHGRIEYFIKFWEK